MASLQFEGETSSFSEKQIQFIRNVLEKRGFENNRVLFEPIGKAGDNYVASVQRVTIKVEDGEDFKMIAKIAPGNETLRLVMNTACMFRNEIAMYEQVLSKFSKIQAAADIPQEERFKYPKCYGCLSEEPNEVVLLEDLAETNYVMLDRFTPLDNNAIMLIIKNFARLHSLSFVLKKHEPGIYEILKRKLVDIWGYANEAPKYKEFLNLVENTAVEVLDDDKYIKAVRGLVDQSTTQATKISKYEATSKHLVVLQGDAWTNNVMFKLEDDKPTDCVMIDYQVSKEGNPAGDLLYMAFNCTDHATRAKHYHEWMDYYHEELDKALSDFGMKANFVYPRYQLDADLKNYSKAHFVTSIVLFYFITRKPEEAEDINNAFKNIDTETESQVELKKVSDSTAKIFKLKIENLIDSCREFGYMA